MKCPRCQHANRRAAKFCDECGTLLHSAEASTQPAPSYADLQSSLTEAQEQQTATAEILRIISQSQTELRPVFAAILECAVRLCGADLAASARSSTGKSSWVDCYPSTPEQWEGDVTRRPRRRGYRGTRPSTPPCRRAPNRSNLHIAQSDHSPLRKRSISGRYFKCANGI